MAELTLLATLKDKLIHADDFASVTHYFSTTSAKT